MRYPKNQKADTRKHLLDVSGALAKKNGFAASGVDMLMKEAGLTSGAFYSHFGSKAELFTALVAHELENSLTIFTDAPAKQEPEEWIARQLRRYLTLKHVNNPEKGCSLPSLAAEIARSDEVTRQTYEEAIKRIQLVWANQLGDEKMAWAAISQLVGAIMLARAMASDNAANEVLEASKSFLEQTLAQSPASSK